MEASLYIHIPFCIKKKCDYCDFFSVPVKPPASADSMLDLYIETLLEEGERLFKNYLLDSIPSVFIGGGTPSILGPANVSKLLSGLSELVERFSSSKPQEITIEANPESANEAFLAAIREGGVSRLSLGVQSFHGPSRKAVNREGDENLLRERLALAAKYYSLSFSADLISGLPFHDEKVLLDDIDELLSFRPAHVSLYALTVAPDTALGMRGCSSLPPRDYSDALWLRGRDALEKAGYTQYEVSNFCLPGKESLHNIRYWRMKNWLALGPSASGTIINDKTGSGLRYTYPSEVDNWKTAVYEDLDTLTLIKESFLMGFRYAEGPDEELFERRFRRTIESCIPKTAEAWRSRGLLRKDKSALTKKGLLFLDAFLREAFQELDV